MERLELEFLECDPLTGELNTDGQLKKFIREKGKKIVNIISREPFENEQYTTVPLEKAKEIAESLQDSGEFDIVRGDMKKFFKPWHDEMALKHYLKYCTSEKCIRGPEHQKKANWHEEGFCLECVFNPYNCDILRI